MARYKRQAREYGGQRSIAVIDNMDTDIGAQEAFIIGYRQGCANMCEEHGTDMLALADLIRLL